MIEQRTAFVLAPAGTRAADLGRRDVYTSETEADDVARANGLVVFIVTVTVEPKES